MPHNQIPPLTVLFNIPKGPFLEDKRNELYDHQQLVKTINPHMPGHPRDRINEGVHAFQALSEDRGLSIIETACVLGMEVEKYTAIIHGVADYTTKDVLKFCDVFEYMPYDLAQNNKSLTPQIRDALLYILEGKSHLLDEDELTEVELALFDDMNNDVTITKIIKARKALFIHKNDGKFDGDIIAEFLDMLIAKDGSYEVSNINDWPEVVENFRLEKQLEKDNLYNRLQISITQRKKHWDAANKIGHRLYPSNSDRLDWSEAYQYLLQARHLLGKSAKKLYHYYRDNCASIGREKWPCFNSTTVKWDKKTYDWRDAQKIHARVMYGYFQAIDDQKDLQKVFELKTKQLRIFDKYCRGNTDLFLRYQNRQHVMHSDSMPEFIGETTRRIRQKMPKIN